jgi:outer membrane protein assembly factor BamB
MRNDLTLSTSTRTAGIARHLFLEFTSVLLLAGLCYGQLTVAVSPKLGPPTSEVLVSGSGFAANVLIDIYFDSVYQNSVYASSSGSFSKVAIQVPASAVPGEHWVSAAAASSNTGTQTAFKVNTNWPELGFIPAGGRNNFYENVLNPTTVANLVLKWNYNIGNFPNDVQLNSSAAVVNGVVYVGSAAAGAGAMFALNAANGKLLWKYPASGAIGSVLSSPAVVPCSNAACKAAGANDVVYFGSADNNVYALNAATGAPLWKYPTGGEVNSSPAVANGVVYIGSNDDHIYALNAAPLSLLWSYATGGPVNSSPAVANGIVYVGSQDGNLYLLNATNGTLVSSQQVCSTSGPVESSPALAAGFAYVGTDTGCISSFLADNGTPSWSDNEDGSAILNAPAVSNNALYYGDQSGWIFALNSSLSGYLEETEGTVIWETFIGTPTDYASQVLANGVLYNASHFLNEPFGLLSAVDASNGTLLWTYPFGQYMEASPTVANGMVYVQSEDGYIYAFGLPAEDSAVQLPARPEISSLHHAINPRVSRLVGTSE